MAISELNDTPSSAEDIDVDRIVWDPAYREAVIIILAKDQEGGYADSDPTPS